MKVMILSYHCMCIRSILSKNNPKPVRIGASRDNNNQEKAEKLPFYASLLAIKTDGHRKMVKNASLSMPIAYLVCGPFFFSNLGHQELSFVDTSC